MFIEFVCSREIERKKSAPAEIGKRIKTVNEREKNIYDKIGRLFDVMGRGKKRVIYYSRDMRRAENHRKPIR